MEDLALLLTLRDEMYRELTGNILPFWRTHTVDARNGGFAGRISFDGTVDARAAKGAILHARILWTFSAAFRMLGDTRDRLLAGRARAYLAQHFTDPEEGGVYWMVDHTGRPSDERKHVYAQAFAIYGLAEHHRATRDAESLDRALALYRLLEEHAADPEREGYAEAFTRSWRPLEDVRLSARDANEKKSMNTHLHVLEAYTNLYRVWPDAALRARLEALIAVFLRYIVNLASGHQWTFFDEAWRPGTDLVSYGHDIETSWLLLEAADVVGSPELRERVRRVVVVMARAVLGEGVDRDGGLFYEYEPGGLLDADKHWWVQAEAVVGFLNAYQEADAPAFLNAAIRAWHFIRQYQVDPRGEWYGRIGRDGTPYPDDKVDFWKCPYHNSRACFEVMERVSVLLEASGSEDPPRRPAAERKRDAS